MSVQINLDKVYRQLSAGTQAKKAVANQIAADMNQYVPKKSNTLRQSLTISVDGSQIFYNTKYAKRQFELKGKNYSTPGTGPRWDLKAKKAYKTSWQNVYLKTKGISK